MDLKAAQSLLGSFTSLPRSYQPPKDWATLVPRTLSSELAAASQDSLVRRLVLPRQGHPPTPALLGCRAKAPRPLPLACLIPPLRR